MAMTLRYTTIDTGAMEFTGNTLGLSSGGGVDVLTSLNNGLQVPGYPAGTTRNYLEDGSMAMLEMTPSATVLYAELMWSSRIPSGVSNLQVPVQFTVPTGQTVSVISDPSTAEVVDGQYYMTANVTDIVRQAGKGAYSVQQVIAKGTFDGANWAGWTLGVIYKDQNLPYRNMNLWTGVAYQNGPTPATDVPISGFVTPISGPVAARVLLSAQEGDYGAADGGVQLGPNTSNLTALSGPNNNVNDFFASQINYANSESPMVGQINTTGTFGALNFPLQTGTTVGRQGWDITNVNGTGALPNSTTNGVIRIDSPFDGYFLNLLGLQVDINAPQVITTKVADKTVVNVGDIITYTIEVPNTGVITADNVNFIDNIPTGTSFVAGSVKVDGAAQTGSTVVGPGGLGLGSIQAGTKKTVEFKLRVESIPSSGKIENNGTTSYTYLPGIGTTPLTGTNTSNKTNASVLQNTKSVDKTAANRGDIITYTATIKNLGTVDADNVLFQDATPSGTIYNGNLVVSTPYTGTNPQGGLTITKVKAGDTVTISWQVKVGEQLPNPNPIINKANVTVAGGSPIPTNEVKTTILDISTANGNGAGKFVDKSVANVGDIITYTVKIKNPGNTPVANVLFQDTIPAGTLYNDTLSVSTAYTGIDPQTGITLTSIAAGELVSISWQVKVEEVVPNTNPVPNTGTVTVPGGRPTSTNTVNTTVLVNTKLVDKAAANVGEIITYTTTIRNPGTTDVMNIDFIDTIPVGTTYNSNLSVTTAYTGMNPQTGLRITKIKAGETVRISWQVKVGNTVPTTNPITNTANITVPGGIPSPTNMAKTTIIKNTKSADKNVANVGDIITYTTTISNPGTTPINGVVFEDATPLGTTYNNNLMVSTAYTGTDPLTGITLTSIKAGEIVTISWQVKVRNSLPTINPITNTATVTTPGGTPTPTNTVSTIILETAKTVDKTYADLGEVITYTATVKNPGTVDVSGIFFKDSIPGGTTYNNNLIVSTAYTGTNPQTGLTLTTIKAGETVVISWQVKVGDVLPNPNPVVNVAFVTVPGGVPIATNSVSTQVNTADISKPGNTSKTADKTVTSPGDIVTYTVTVKNTGNVLATDVIVKDALPAGTTFVDGSVTINSVVKLTETPVAGIAVGSINPGDTKVVKFKVVIGDKVANPVVNTATITYSYSVNPNKPPVTPEPVITPPATLEVKRVKLTLEKASNRQGVKVGDVIQYSLTVKNQGQLVVDNVILKDPLTIDVVFADNVKLNGNSIQGNIQEGINIGTLGIGQTDVLTFDARVISVPNNKEKTIVNQSTGNYEYRANPTDVAIKGTLTSNTNTIKVYLPSMKVSKTSSRENILVGDNFNYNIIVTNTGDISLNNVVVKDVLPVGFKVTAIQVEGITVAGNLVEGINIGTIGLSQDKVVKISVVIEDTVKQSTFKNIVRVEGKAQIDANFPPAIVTEQGTDENGVGIYNPKLVLKKSGDKASVIEGEIITYTIIATNEASTNISNTRIDNVIISDTLSAQLEFVRDSVKVNGAMVTGGNILAGVNIGSLAVGQSKTVTFQAKVLDSKTTPIVNEAKAKYSFTLPGEAGIQKEASSNPYQLNVFKANVRIVKTASQQEVLLGDTLTYTVELINDGNTIANNVLFKDALPAEIQMIQGTFTLNGKAINGIDLKKGIVVGSIGVGKKIVLMYKVKVIGSNCGSVVTNEAMATFKYRLLDGTTGTQTATGGIDMTNTTQTPIGITTFKQMSVESYLGIPQAKPDIEAINLVSGTIDIAGCHVINTPQTVSVEGQNLTGYKLIVRGVLNVVVEYTALDVEQSVHSAHYTVPFSTFIILPPNYQMGSKLEVTGVVEDIYYNAIDIRNLFQNTTALINVKILSC